MDELIRFLASHLVENPDAIEIHEEEVDGLIHIKLKVAENDVGRVIGKQGKIAKAMRSILKSACSRESKKYVLDIV